MGHYHGRDGFDDVLEAQGRVPPVAPQRHRAVQAALRQALRAAGELAAALMPSRRRFLKVGVAGGAAARGSRARCARNPAIARRRGSDTLAGPDARRTGRCWPRIAPAILAGTGAAGPAVAAAIGERRSRGRRASAPPPGGGPAAARAARFAAGAPLARRRRRAVAAKPRSPRSRPSSSAGAPAASALLQQALPGAARSRAWRRGTRVRTAGRRSAIPGRPRSR